MHRLLPLETAIKRLRKDGTAMSYNVTLKTLPERYVASVRQIISAYAYEGRLWHILVPFKPSGRRVLLHAGDLPKPSTISTSAILFANGKPPVLFRTELVA